MHRGRDSGTGRPRSVTGGGGGQGAVPEVQPSNAGPNWVRGPKDAVLHRRPLVVNAGRLAPSFVVPAPSAAPPSLCRSKAHIGVPPPPPVSTAMRSGPFWDTLPPPRPPPSGTYRTRDAAAASPPTYVPRTAVHGTHGRPQAPAPPPQRRSHVVSLCHTRPHKWGIPKRPVWSRQNPASYSVLICKSLRLGGFITFGQKNKQSLALDKIFGAKNTTFRPHKHRRPAPGLRWGSAAHPTNARRGARPHLRPMTQAPKPPRRSHTVLRAPVPCAPPPPHRPQDAALRKSTVLLLGTICRNHVPSCDWGQALILNYVVSGDQDHGLVDSLKRYFTEPKVWGARGAGGGGGASALRSCVAVKGADGMSLKIFSLWVWLCTPSLCLFGTRSCTRICHPQHVGGGGGGAGLHQKGQDLRGGPKGG